MNKNLYKTISKFTTSSIYYDYLFSTNSDFIQLDNTQFEIYPLNIFNGIKFYLKLTSIIYKRIQKTFFETDFNSEIIYDGFNNIEVMNDLFNLISEAYSIDHPNFKSLLQKSTYKEIKYFIYIIKKQNFISTIDEKQNRFQYALWMDAAGELDEILFDYVSTKRKAKTKEVDIKDAIDYNIGNTISLSADSTIQFFIDYVVGQENFYMICSNTFISKFFTFHEYLPDKLLLNKPSQQCRINDSNCIQSCSNFPECDYRFVKKDDYLPFRAMYILPQLIELHSSLKRDTEIDNLTRSLLYSLSALLKKSDNIESMIELNHNSKVFKISELNKEEILKNLLPAFDISDIRNELRFRLNLEEKVVDNVKSLMLIVGKIYTFVENNRMVFVKDDRVNIIDDFVLNHIRPLIVEHKYISKNLQISNDEDFTMFILSKKREFNYLDNILRKFPNDMDNMNTLISGLLANLRNSKKQMAKMGGSKIIDPRESLLVSDSILHRRIAVDNALFSFYKENNKTKMVNNILFQKWSIALFYFADVIMKLDESHEIWNMNFNEM